MEATERRLVALHLDHCAECRGLCAALQALSMVHCKPAR
ncbi:MAG: hypothetical protein ACK2UP_13300 [Candidatus Promineifilaceae bacterium]